MLDEYQRIVYETLRNALTNPPEEDPEKKIEEDILATAINSRKMEILKHALEKSKASRVAIFTYHNGGKDYLGRSHQRMSCTNETTAPGVSSIQNKYNNIYRTFLWYVYSNLQNSPHIDMSNICDYKDIDYPMYDACMMDNVQAMYIHSIKDKRDRDVGYVAFMFDKPQIDQEIPETVKATAHQLEALIYI